MVIYLVLLSLSGWIFSKYFVLSWGTFLSLSIFRGVLFIYTRSPFFK